MEKTPKSLRLHIGLFGRTNVGKSSFLNYIAGQDVAITSHVPGTTTDVVEKAMELLPLGPVVFLDTAGLDDRSVLAEARLKKTRLIFDRCDVIVLLTEAGRWDVYEDEILAQARSRRIPVVTVVNKIDVQAPSPEFLSRLEAAAARVFLCSCVLPQERDRTIAVFKKHLIETAPDDFLNPPALIGDLLPPAGLAVLIVPIDLQAPKGRLILPQVQTIRDALDNDAAALVVKEREYAHFMSQLKSKPDIVVCDSQAVLKMVADTPPEVKCTTFSILFSRLKADLVEAARAVRAIDALRAGDRVLIAEACSHHAIEDDIGRVKIPRWLRQYTGLPLRVDVTSGKDFPEDIGDFKVVIHCGACMFTRREMLARVEKARAAGISLTNYGVAIAFLQGALERVLSPFPAALEAFRQAGA